MTNPKEFINHDVVNLAVIIESWRSLAQRLATQLDAQLDLGFDPHTDGEAVEALRAAHAAGLTVREANIQDDG